MSLRVILAPQFVQVALTLVLMVWMGFTRVRALRRGEAKVFAIAFGRPYWPAKTQQITNCFANQFQLRVLFCVLTALTVVTHPGDLVFVVLAWLFVATRLVHDMIHTTSNFVPRRFYAYLAGAIVLFVMWITFAASILLGAP